MVVGRFGLDDYPLQPGGHPVIVFEPEVAPISTVKAGALPPTALRVALLCKPLPSNFYNGFRHRDAWRTAYSINATLHWKRTGQLKQCCAEVLAIPKLFVVSLTRKLQMVNVVAAVYGLMPAPLNC